MQVRCRQQQFGQQHAKAVDIGGGRQGLTGSLLGAGIAWRASATTGLGIVFDDGGIDQLRDAEIQQQGPTIGSDQDIRWLQIAMHDQALMGNTDCRTHGVKQAQHGRRRQSFLTAILFNAATVDVLHHQIRLAARCRAAIKQARDIGMRQSRQDLPFLGQVRECIGTGNAAQQFDRDHLFEMAIAALRKINRAHAAVRNLALQLPCAEHIASLQ